MAVKPNATLGDIEHVIQRYAEKSDYPVIREYCEHSIHKEVHEELQVIHYGKPNTGPKLQTGMTFMIEPMLNQGQ